MKTTYALLAALLLPPALGMAASAPELPSFLPPFAAEYPTPADGLLELSPEEPPGDLANGAEIVVLSGNWTTEAERRGVGVKVTIDRPGAKVLLALAAYQNVYWQVTATPGTRLAGILASGYHRPVVTANVTVPAFLTKDGYATHPSEYDAWLTRMKRRFGVEKIDVFQAVGTIPPEIVIRELDPPRVAPAPPGKPKPEEPETNFVFKLVTEDLREEAWTLTGRGGEEAAEDGRFPKKYRLNRHEALSPDKKRLYTVGHNRMRIRDLETGREREVPLPAAFPELFELGGVAYDSKRDLLVLTPDMGRGCLYRFDAKKEKWLDFRQGSRLVSESLAYDPATDRFVGIEGNPVAPQSLIFISGEGEYLFTRNLGPLKNGTYSVVFLSILQVIPHGDDIALVDIDPGEPGRHEVRAIWHYNVGTDKTALTFYRPERD